jgi:hypothetical protein
MAYRSGNLRRVLETPLEGIPCESTCYQSLGHTAGDAALVGFRIGPNGWLHFNPDGRSRYFVVHDGVATFIDDSGALEIMERGSTFGADADVPLTLRTVEGCDLFMVEAKRVEAPSPSKDYRIEQRRAARRARSWWRRLANW